MAATDRFRLRKSRFDHPAAGPSLALAGITLVLLASTAAAVWILPFALVLPTLSLAALLIAGVVALIAIRRSQPASRHPSYWDIAGGLALIGMCAAMLSEPDQVLPLLEGARQNR